MFRVFQVLHCQHDKQKHQIIGFVVGEIKDHDASGSQGYLERQFIAATADLVEEIPHYLAPVQRENRDQIQDRPVVIYVVQHVDPDTYFYVGWICWVQLQIRFYSDKNGKENQLGPGTGKCNQDSFPTVGYFRAPYRHPPKTMKDDVAIRAKGFSSENMPKFVN